MISIDLTKCNVIMDAELIVANSYTGDAAILLGDNDSDYGKPLHLEVRVRRHTLDLADTVYGARLYNILNGEIYIHKAINFSIGIITEGLGTGHGFAWNQVFLKDLTRNGVGLLLTVSATGGFNNENTFYGGSIVGCTIGVLIESNGASYPIIMFLSSWNRIL